MKASNVTQSRDYHKSSPVSIRLSDDLRDWATAKAARESRSVASIVIEALTNLKDTKEIDNE